MSNNKSVVILVSAVDKFTKPMKGINQSTDKLAKNIVDMQKKAGKITGFKNLEKQLGKTASELGEARNKLSSLGRELKSTENPTRSLQREFESAKRKVQLLDQAHKKHRQSLRNTKSELKDAGMDTRKLADEEDNLTQKLNKQWKVLSKIKSRRQALQKINEKIDRVSNRAANFALVGQAGSQLSRSIFGKGRDLIGSVRDLDLAKGELASLGVRDINTVVETGRTLSKRLAGVTAASFVAASYDIKSGIDTLTDQGVAEMTKSAVITAKATKAAQQEMTSLFATGYGIFKRKYAGQSDQGFSELFSAAIAKSVQQFKTTGSAMQQAIQSMGAGATNLGMSLSDQLTTLGRLQGVMSPGEAGTALRSFAQNSAKAQQAFAKLAEEGNNPAMVKLLGKDGMLRSMPEILKDIKNRYGDSLNALELEEIKKAFGTDEAVKVINNLYGQEEAFRANSRAIQDAQEKGIGFTESMAKMIDNTPTARLDMLIQRINLLKENIADKLLNVLDKYHLKIETGIDSISKWTKENKNLVVGGIVLATVIGGLAALLVPFALGVSILNGSMALFKGLIATISVLTSPLALKIAAVVAVIGVLAGAAYLVVRNWEPIVNIFSNIANDIKAIFAKIVVTILESMQSVFAVMPDWALPKSLERNNISSTISKYRSLAKGGSYKPVSFKGFDFGGDDSSFSLSSVSRKLGLDELIQMAVSDQTKGPQSGSKIQNNAFKLEAPITINATPGMNAEEVAKKAREELERMLEQVQTNYNLAANS